MSCLRGPFGPNMTGISTGFFGHVKTLTNSVVAVYVVFESYSLIRHKLNFLGYK